MNGFNNCLFHKYWHVIKLLKRVIICAAILTSSALQAGTLEDEVIAFTLHREKISEAAPSVLLSGQPPEIEVTEQSGIYKIEAVAVINASASHVRRVLTDFIHIHRMNPSIIESDVVKQYDDDSVCVSTRIIGCAANFCEELDRVERVRILPSGDLYAEIIPEQSQFKSGETFWRIKELGEYCEVSYLSEMQPDIFIPPVVGKFLIKQSIKEEAKISFSNLEKIANILAEREWQEDYQPEHNAFSSYDFCSINEDATDP